MRQNLNFEHRERSLSLNKKWFTDQLRDKQLTQAGLAERLNMSPSGLSLLLSGQRRMRVEQAAEIARLFGVPVSDVMRNATDNVSTAGKLFGEPFSVPVVGWIDDVNAVKLDLAESKMMVEVEAGFPKESVALQWRTTQTRQSICDGWIAITSRPVEPDHAVILDRFCLVCCKDGRNLVRRVARGYSAGHYTLLDFTEAPIHDAAVATASPILAIKPV